MFREYEAVYTPPAPKGSGKEILNITVLNGDATQIPYYSFMSMSEVQMQIHSKLNIPPNKQKILFEDKEVQVFIINVVVFKQYKPSIYNLYNCASLCRSKKESNVASEKSKQKK